MLEITPNDPGPARPSDPGSLVRGISLGSLINVGMLLIGCVTIPLIIGVAVVAGFGVLQFAWITPVYMRFRWRGETETAKGLLVAAGVTVLLSAGCWGVIFFPAV